ncbi:ROK family protein [Oceanobacillus sp. J11TS1]|uniref:ROK family protein n=1 Tax=Oceanobacillus sp. J11TS1 TaxID=2807191 RepID=UPI001B1DC8FF|nr:ROK family protein [Oceanobacillus sp. J11TS1]GIO22110.1 fructokinase [Oceanobacillus sp. J11TS1]
MIGAIEAGGTKFVCAVGYPDGTIVDRTAFPTTTPEETLAKVEEFFSKHPVEKIGVGAFGPINLRTNSENYGAIENTPKIPWRHYPLLEELKKRFNLPVAINTDVAVACLGEYEYGIGKDVSSCLYITVGTGIGAGLVQDGNPFQGKNHSEMGHILLRKHPDDRFEGICPSHGACLEGLASGPAIEARHGRKGAELAEEDHVWEIEAYYLAQAILNYFVVLSPEKIILGGGVMKQEKLYPMIRKQFMELLNGYIEVENVDELIVAPGLDDDQGVKGCIALAVKE